LTIFRIQLYVELSAETKEKSTVQQEESYVTVGIKRKITRKRRWHAPVHDGSCRIHNKRLKASDLGLNRLYNYFKNGIVVSYCAGSCSTKETHNNLFIGVHKKPCCVATEFWPAADVIHSDKDDMIRTHSFEAFAKRCACR